MATKIGEAKLINSFRGLRFEITPSDIRNGQPNDPCSCAAARALRRRFDAKAVFVYRNVTYILRKDGSALRYTTTAPLRLETIVFDRNGEFFPGEYDLAPGPDREPTKKKRSASSSSSKSNRKVGVRYVIPNVRPTASTKLPRV